MIVNSYPILVNTSRRAAEDDPSIICTIKMLLHTNANVISPEVFSSSTHVVSYHQKCFPVLHI